MDKMRVCFVGIGSIAKRHIKNLHEICNVRGLSIQIDAYRREKEFVEGVSDIYDTIDNVPDNYDAIFITNPTEFHLESLCQFHNKSKHFFIEKPVVSLGQLDNAKSFQMRDDCVYYVAAPLRYNAVVQWIKNNVKSDTVLAVRGISSSYLPDWRPDQDYRKTYSARKELGGGVSTDLVHEWDYLTQLFGWPQKVQAMTGKKSDLEIDTDDYAIYMADFGGMICELHLDYFGRHTIREVELFTKDDTILCDILRNRVTFLNNGRSQDFNEQRDDYQKRELNYFLDMVLGMEPLKSEYKQAIKVLELTQGKC